MGKTPASTRAGRKSKAKHSERKWCTCQERCSGGKEVAASTYRSHNPIMKTIAVRDGREGGPVAVAGCKRKAGSDVDGLGSNGGLRETRGMRARRIAQDGGPTSQPPLTATGCPTRALELGDVRPQELEAHEHREAQVQECVGDDEEEERPSWVPSVEAYPIENGNEDDDYEEDDQIRATIRSVNKMVSAILSWD